MAFDHQSKPTDGSSDTTFDVDAAADNDVANVSASTVLDAAAVDAVVVL